MILLVAIMVKTALINLELDESYVFIICFKLSDGCDFGKLLAKVFHKIVFKRSEIEGYEILKASQN